MVISRREIFGPVRHFWTDVASLVQPSHLGLDCLCCATQGNEVQYSPPTAEKHPPPPPTPSVPAIVTVHEAASGVLIGTVRGTSWTVAACCRKYVSAPPRGTGRARRTCWAASSLRTFLNALKSRVSCLSPGSLIDAHLKPYQIGRLQERRVCKTSACKKIVPMAAEFSSSVAEEQEYFPWVQSSLRFPFLTVSCG